MTRGDVIAETDTRAAIAAARRALTRSRIMWAVQQLHRPGGPGLTAPAVALKATMSAGTVRNYLKDLTDEGWLSRSWDCDIRAWRYRPMNKEEGR